MVFYDTHAHLDYPDYAKDFAGVLERASAAGIAKIVAIGTDLESSRRVVELSEKHPSIYAAVGWHPSNVMEAPDDIRPALLEMAAHPKVVALGETGMDYHRLPSQQPGGDAAADAPYKEKQAALFAQHLEIAAKTGLNCVIHQRDSLADTIRLMEPFADRVRGVFHCFVDGPEVQKRLAAMNCLVSFTGIVTFKNAQLVRETVRATPLGGFMLETDCPYLAPVPYRGKRCEPAYVKEIAQTVADNKGCSLQELSEATCDTARRFFPKMA